MVHNLKANTGCAILEACRNFWQSSVFASDGKQDFSAFFSFMIIKASPRCYSAMLISCSTVFIEFFSGNDGLFDPLVVARHHVLGHVGDPFRLGHVRETVQ
jgi:hypothetical protein